ncbi:MAG: (2Fe-2S)-binding protein [Planctomycetota bacterium]|nr:(2Fe-2S)-binding protein [Planctomycetota bacterium]
MKVPLRFLLNGREVALEVQPHARLLDALRDYAGLTGTKEGCGEGECGACTVLVDGRAVNSCLYPALEAEGCAVLTVEGLVSAQGGLSELQQAFVEEGGAQCGFCTPGMVMSAAALLSENAAPSDDEIREALVGNLCRCTGYTQIVASIRAAAQKAGKAQS